MFGVLSRHNVDQTIVNRGEGNELVAGAAPADGVHGVLEVRVELPEQLRVSPTIAPRVEAVHPAISAGEDHLRLASERAIRGRSPLGVLNICAGGFVGPEELARPA